MATRPPPLLPLLAMLLAGCGAEEPVLQGVPPEPLLATEERTERTARTVSEAEAGYARAADVYVDVHYLGGASYRQSRDVVAEQLGALQQTTELPAGSGQRMDFERGAIQVLDDHIYMLQIPLPQPVRRTAALAELGFPPFVGRYVTLHREYRLNNTWSFRRIRMKRSSPADELVTEVEAWHSVPGEPPPGR